MLKTVKTVGGLAKMYSKYFKGFSITKEALEKAFAEEPINIHEFAIAVFEKIGQAIEEAYQSNVITQLRYHQDMKINFQEIVMYISLHRLPNIKSFQTKMFHHDIMETKVKYPDVEGFEIFSVSCCKPCDNFYQKKLSVEEALQHASETESRCISSYGGCRTTYIPIFSDQDESLIKITLGTV